LVAGVKTFSRSAMTVISDMSRSTGEEQGRSFDVYSLQGDVQFPERLAEGALERLAL
ncbi:unnamed protein product, partial [Nesidiocoris tenuis]